jgi:hypothetical protein
MAAPVRGIRILERDPGGLSPEGEQGHGLPRKARRTCAPDQEDVAPVIDEPTSMPRSAPMHQEGEVGRVGPPGAPGPPRSRPRPVHGEGLTEGQFRIRLVFPGRMADDPTTPRLVTSHGIGPSESMSPTMRVGRSPASSRRRAPPSAPIRASGQPPPPAASGGGVTEDASGYDKNDLSHVQSPSPGRSDGRTGTANKNKEATPLPAPIGPFISGLWK